MCGVGLIGHNIDIIDKTPNVETQYIFVNTFVLIGNYQQPSSNNEAGGSMSGTPTNAADGYEGKL